MRLTSTASGSTRSRSRWRSSATSSGRPSTSPSPSAPRSLQLSRRRSPPAGSGLAGLPEDRRTGRPDRLPGLVGVRAGGLLAAPERPGQRRPRPRPPSCRPCRQRGRRRLRHLGGQGAADRGGVGVRRPRRPRRGGLRLGRRVRRPAGGTMANTWQGRFPWREPRARTASRGTSPVGSLPAQRLRPATTWPATSGSGPRTTSPRHRARLRQPCCAPRNPRGDRREESFDPAQPEIHIPRKVIKGGSHLCAPSYCLRYRPAARQGEAIDTSTSHIGFRCVVRGE